MIIARGNPGFLFLFFEKSLKKVLTNHTMCGIIIYVRRAREKRSPQNEEDNEMFKTSKVAIDYIQDQINSYERIKESFPSLSPFDHFLGHDIVKSVRVTLNVLYFAMSEIKHAKDQEEVKSALLDLWKDLNEEPTEEMPAEIVMNIINHIDALYEE